ncbi:serine hydrolase domain-containing protein [Streptomyces sp. NPDC005805]|uniref:serine hydrolase domain-containing protein n=1 Tax=Streptomyces sp. NPDC005805 TaxID=3157068 RepID=UPI0033F7DD94
MSLPGTADPAVFDEDSLRQALADAVGAVDAPDVVFALSHGGRRLVVPGGTGPRPAVPRERARYEIGSASKTFTGLVLARLVEAGRLSGSEPAARWLDPAGRVGRAAPTPTHLITHTSGLPRLPADFYPRAARSWSTNPYADYPAHRLVGSFLRARPRHRPGTRWRYSNFGVAALGHVLAEATGTEWEELVAREVLRPLRLDGTALSPGGPDTDARGHRSDGVRPVPPLDTGGFAAAGAVRATPDDLLTYLEAHLRPDGHPSAGALRAVLRPVLRRGPGRREVHSLTWFRHATDAGPVYFHSGATSGQQAFLGLRPDTGTALVALSTRRFRMRDGFVALAYGLLAGAPAPV